GIRDFHVTGVQTCALPIFVRIRLRVPCLSSLKKRLWFRTALIPICNGASLQLWMAHRKRPICGCDQRRKPERLHGTYSCFGKQRSEERRVGKELRYGW